LRKLFIPTAVIGGFLILGLGPEGMGRLIGGAGLFPENEFSVWRQLPAHLVTLMSASLLLGEHLRPVRKIWRLSGAHVIMISVMVAPLIILAVAAIGWSVFVTDVVKRLQLSADHYASDPRRWLRDGARRAADQSLWVASLHDRGCGDDRGTDRLGNKEGRPRGAGS